MKRTTAAILHMLSFAGLFAVIWFVFRAGKGLEAGAGVLVGQRVPVKDQLSQAVTEAFKHPLAIFILQLILIIVVSQVCAYIFRKIGQPSVMGEIIAGILLGPSLMGTAIPEFSAFVFPKASLGNLQMLSQVGLILFMFMVGMELDMEILKKRARASLFISHFSIVVPFGLGIGLSYFLYQRFAPSNIPFYAFSLFIGIAMSITAFPVLARIIRERGLLNTKLGTIAIISAAVNDVTAWCILAFIIAIVKAGSVNSSIYALIAVAAYVLVMVFAVRPLLKKISTRQEDKHFVKRSAIAIVFVVLLLSSYCCEVIGIHALFGAFLAGAIMPNEWNFRKLLIDKIEDVALVLLLPLFFVFTGLRTQIGLLNDSSLWLICGVIILVAVAGKFGGSAVAARLTGENLQDSLSIGALMNTRGLVELVVLNIGYDLGILTPQMFTMMVLMALVTTFMTNPAINLINRVYASKNKK
jgi:Kef-type K+ transport system membrane component KefB